jgi:AcrR family transcriptional regulator
MQKIPSAVKDEGLVQKRREQILLGAIELFSKNGFHKSTLDELAKASGISHGSIYSYIKSKEDIFSLIHEFLYKKLYEGIENTVYEKNPIEKLKQLIRADLNLTDKWSKTVLLLYQESHILKGDRLVNLLKQERAHIAKYEEVIQECIDQGYLAKTNVRATANIIKTMMDSWVVKQWDLKSWVNKSEMEKLIIQILLEGLGNRKKSRACRRGNQNKKEPKAR